MVKINGEQTDAAGKSVETFLKEAGYCEARVAVEYGGDILPRTAYGNTILKDGDSLEIVSFVGGG